MRVDAVPSGVDRPSRPTTQRTSGWASSASASGTARNSAGQVPWLDTLRRVVGSWRHRLETLNAALRSYYRLCGSTSLVPDEHVGSDAVGNLRLGASQVVRLERSCGAGGLTVEEGTVWLTATPARGDVLLRAGEHHLLRDGWPFVIQALGEARVALNGMPSPSSSSTFRSTRRIP